ncbi:MAG: hypothetical protein JXR36_03320 [Bacteroidales bacterium]|nr:hypothetical protein [Bacteroidales bacterium]
MEEKIKFSKEEMIRAEKSGHRTALIEAGIYAVPQHKVHKNKKKYDRKQYRNSETW